MTHNEVFAYIGKLISIEVEEIGMTPTTMIGYAVAEVGKTEFLFVHSDKTIDFILYHDVLSIKLNKTITFEEAAQIAKKEQVHYSKEWKFLSPPPRGKTGYLIK